jgi:hypothetical protein
LNISEYDTWLLRPSDVTSATGPDSITTVQGHDKISIDIARWISLVKKRFFKIKEAV